MRLERLKSRFASAALTVAVVSAIGIAALMFLTTADVILRRGADYSIPGALESAEVLLVITVFLGLAHTYIKGQHVEITMLADRMSERVQRWVTAAGRVVASVALLWLCYATGIAAWDSFQAREYRIGLVDVPIWPARVAIAVGSVFLLLVVVANVRDRRG